MNTKQYSVIGRKLSLLLALPVLACLLLLGGTNANANDKENVYDNNTSAGENQRSGPRRLFSRISEKGRKVKNALVDHHRRERAFIIGLVTREERRYERKEEKYRNPAPAPTPAHEYSQAAPAPVYKPAPKPAPAPVPTKKTPKYPGYSGY